MRSHLTGLTIFLALSPNVTVPAAPPDQARTVTHQLDIPAQDLGAALRAFSAAANEQVLFSREIVAGKHSARLKGEYSTNEALEALLKGSGLKAERTPSGVLLIRAAEEGQSAAPVSKTNLDVTPFRLAQIPSSSSAANADGMQQGDRHGEHQPASERTALEEIVITGTHIRGAVETASPIRIFSREDIEQAGASSVGQFIQMLPQNFSGHTVEMTATAVGPGLRDDRVNATGASLRGLGSDATLVLINGRRIAPGNTSGDFVDLSMIPLNAIERIEIVSDGASAIYGADAVGGVVNIILTRKFDGAESHVRYGAVSTGDRNEIQAGQLLGRSWETGSVLLTYEYLDTDPLSASYRRFAQSAPEPFTLLPASRRQGGIVAVTQEVGESAELFFDGGYSRRDTTLDTSSLFFQSRELSNTRAHNATLGLRVLLGDHHLEVAGSYSKSSTRYQSLELQDSPVATLDWDVDSTLKSTDLKLDGPLLETRAGTILFAAGGQYRKEAYDNLDRASGQLLALDRDLYAGFLELRIPVLGPRSDHVSPTLEISVAGRTERYSDFGSSTNPQVGFVWRPATGLKVRGSAGTSFLAPVLSDTNPLPRLAIPFALPDPLKSGTCDFLNPSDACTNTLSISGGNPNLGPQDARTWTLGMDLDFVQEAGWKASLTYYDVHFKNRIANPNEVVSDILAALSQEAVAGQTIIQRNPPAEYIQSFVNSPAFVNPFGIDPSTIEAILDRRLQNLVQVDSSGVDFSGSYERELGAGRLEIGIDGSCVFQFEDQFTRASPVVSILNTPYNLVDLRMRQRTRYSRGPFDATLFINYVDDYEDNRSDQRRHIASWTTVDAVIGYRFPQGGVLNGTRVTLAVTNIADRDPPFVENLSFSEIQFDGANASPLGRFFSVKASKTW